MIIFVWITMLTPAYKDKIVGELAEMGFSVGPLDDDRGVLFDSGDSLSVLMAMCLEVPHKLLFDDEGDKKEETVVVFESYNMIKEMLRKRGIKYHSLVATNNCHTKFGLGNISLKELEEQKAKRKKQHSYLRLVPKPVQTKEEPPPELPT